ncbi:MAG: TetR/AcrR family transcriptional regulator [Acidimicrobiales bacterium]
MGHKHDRDAILSGALKAAMDDGLSQLTFGRLAKRLAISDRIIVYYFPSKDDLVGEVLTALGAQLQHTLGPAFSVAADDYLGLVRTAWPMLAQPEADPIFAMYFEALGLAAAKRQPYHALVPTLVETWIEWAAALIGGPPERGRTQAEAAIAVIDGLLLLRQTAGPAAADRAAGLLAPA